MFRSESELFEIETKNQLARRMDFFALLAGRCCLKSELTCKSVAGRKSVTKIQNKR